jgi:hypothetical protein
MNNMFGSSNLPYGYPNMAAPVQVAPVYDPPVPGTGSGWNYGPQPTYTQPAYAQPAYSQPALPTYGSTQPGPPAVNSYAPAVDAYGSNTGMDSPPSATTNPPPLEPTPSGQGRGQSIVKPAPRPFSNPQEAGQAFVQRSTTRTTYGGNDGRFRPPELKGTP